MRQSTLYSQGRWILGLLVVGLMMVIINWSVSAFMLEGAPGTPFSGPMVEPHEKPPFLHFDLREFPGCTVPYTIHEDGPNDDVDRDGDMDQDDIDAAFAAVQASFQTWQSVSPSIISFTLQPATTDVRVVRMDGQNTLFWLTDPSDDVQVIPFGQGRPNRVCVTAGPNGTIETVPMPMFDQDDQTVGNVINTGPNGICQSQAGGDVQVIAENQGLPHSVIITAGGLFLDPATIAAVGGDDVPAFFFVTSGPNGIAETQAAGADVQVIPVGQGEPNTVAIQPGANLTIESVPGGDDQPQGYTITTGANGICQTRANDDVQVIPLYYGEPNSIGIRPGTNGVLDTEAQGDDVVAGNEINTGANGVCESQVNGHATGAVAITGVFFNNQSGVIIESDIWFNDVNPAFQWNTGVEDENNNMFDIQVTATHEIGHAIGLHHDDRFPAATMSNTWPADTTKQSLEQDDENGCSFLYTPDLGDAPHIDNIFSDIFSTKVHGPSGGRVLNERTLDVIYPGPMHKFGICPNGRYTYEWLGDSVDQECYARIVDWDDHDDGVTFNPYPPECGKPLEITVTVSTNADVLGGRHDYGTDKLWVNVWMDYVNINGRWEEPDEHIIHEPLSGAGQVKTTVVFPDTYKTVWLRARLDWGEDVHPSGLGRPGLSPDLLLTEGAASFGEVEDYPLRCPRPYKVEYLYGPYSAVKYWTSFGYYLDTVAWDYSYQVDGMEEPEVETVTGALDFRALHPEFEGMNVMLSLYLPPYPHFGTTDWHEIITYDYGTADVTGVGMFGPPWEYLPFELLPETHWRVPVLAPAHGGKTSPDDTIYTAINLSLYYDSNPLGFNGGDWVALQTLSELEVEIIDGEVDGTEGIYFSTTPFVFDSGSPTGFTSVGGPSSLLNSAEYPVDIVIVEEKTDEFVAAVLPITITIEKTHDTYQGQYEYVSITLEDNPIEMGGFDFLIAYDASALAFTEAEPGQLLEDCGWEYFTYRYGAVGNCGDACPSGLLRIVAIAETNNGANHPSCFGPPDADPHELAELTFLVTDDRTFECQYVPIRFFWIDCGDNAVSSVTGDTLFVSDHVYEFDGTDITDPTYGFPTYFGVQQECLDGGDPDKPTPIQFFDFWNGGIDIICADSIDVRGDINLNEVGYEVADAVMFANYFVYGLSVFNVNLEGQIAASDVNADGITLSVADLVYLIRVVIGDAAPYPKTITPAEGHYVLSDGGRLEAVTEAPLGAAFVVVDGDAVPELLADNMEMRYAFDGTATRILVYSLEGESFSGEFLKIGGEVLSVEMATADGNPVVTELLPDRFALHQNYPNPFNATTTITFDVKEPADYTLTIYNMNGREVEVLRGRADPGVKAIIWDASAYASGVYLYKLEIGNFSDTKKMVLVK